MLQGFSCSIFVRAVVASSPPAARITGSTRFMVAPRSSPIFTAATGSSRASDAAPVRIPCLLRVASERSGSQPFAIKPDTTRSGTIIITPVSGSCMGTVPFLVLK